MRMIFIFIDGFGIGEECEDKNPIYFTKTPNIDYIFNNFKVIPTDATLGVPGLPQSATGQTTIFTGENASKVLGRHLHAQPTQALKDIINKKNLFSELMKIGLKVTNSNVYRQKYLDNLTNLKDKRLKPSVTTVMSLASGITLRTVEDYKKGNGVYHDITGQILVDSGYDLTPITVEEAAKNLYNISREYDFTLYEHFMTDIIGHTMDRNKAIDEIKLLDDFLGELLKRVDLEKDIIFITSDHGNIEDISVKTHTYNKVPTIIISKNNKYDNLHIDSLVDIFPTVLKIFEMENKI